MKRKAALSALLAMVVAAPVVIAPAVAPSLAPQARAADAEYPDVPLDHWAYNAINKLSQAGIIEGYPNGTYSGGRAMTRYEFAVAVARILQNIQVAQTPGTPGVAGVAGAKGDKGDKGDSVPQTLPEDLVHRPELLSAIAALRDEFRTELRALGVRVDDLDNRVTALENRVVKPPRMTWSASLLHRTGAANYINDDLLGRLGGTNTGGVAYFNTPFTPAADLTTDGNSLGSKKFSYTDFELRLTDRVTDNLTLNAALRDLSGTQEDPWTGESGILGGLLGGNGFYLREANAVADLGNRVGVKNLTVILGRQRTKIAQGLLYDNDLAPTDQLHAIANLGPVEVSGFIGSTNNNTVGGLGFSNPYLGSGSNLFIGALNGDGNGSTVGFPGPIALIPGVANRTDDNEALVHGALNLFKIAGQPVRLGATYLFDGVANQDGYGFDLSVPLFNRVVGIEYVKQQHYALNDGLGADESSDGHAFNVTVPVLRLKKLDLDLAYGHANDDFEFFLASSANPFARTYGEAIFDRDNALGAPLINGDGKAGDAQYMAAKKVFDVKAKLRLIKRLPLDLRYYTAKGTDDRRLGYVASVGTTFKLTEGLDLEVKYGIYNPKGDFDTLKYFRVGANVGF